MPSFQIYLLLKDKKSKIMRLPEKSHFMKDGIFSHSHLRPNKPLPVEILNYVFPDYIIRNRLTINKKKLEMVEDYCIYLRKLAKKEERKHRQAEKLKKEEEEFKKWEKELDDRINNVLNPFTPSLMPCIGSSFFNSFKNLCSLKNADSK